MTVSYPRWSFSSTILGLGPIAPLKKLYASLARHKHKDVAGGFVCVVASELLKDGHRQLPKWAEDSETRFLVVSDVADAALMRIPEILGLRKPSTRVHVTSDHQAPARLLIAHQRQQPSQGIVDAYFLLSDLVVVLGDLSIRYFPVKSIAELNEMRIADLKAFEIDKGGSYLYWSKADVHLGPVQLLQQVDPSFFADLEIARYSLDTTALTLISMRESRSLRQGDITGLSERQVRRLEKGISRLTLDAAEKLASAFSLSLSQFLDEFAKWASQTTDQLERRRDGDAREIDGLETEDSQARRTLRLTND